MTQMKIIGQDNVPEQSKFQLLKLSASSIKTYDSCQLKYYYNYIQKAPRKEWTHFLLGNLCHRALEIFHEIYIKEGLKFGSLSKLMEHSFKEARKEFNVADSVLAEAKELLKGYLKSIKRNGMPMVKGIETEFKINLTDDILLRGFLDRLDITKDGKFKIVDYKTTKNEKYLDHFQLLLYGLWLKEEYPNTDTFSGSYILLRHGSREKQYTFNTDDIDKCKKEVLGYADKIRTSMAEDVWTPLPSILCKWCDFNNICPTQQW